MWAVLIAKREGILAQFGQKGGFAVWDLKYFYKLDLIAVNISMLSIFVNNDKITKLQSFNAVRKFFEFLTVFFKRLDIIKNFAFPVSECESKN